MKKYKNIKDSILPIKSKCCQKCSHWNPDETDITKRILKGDSFYEENTNLFDKNVWVGSCSKSNEIDYFKYSESIKEFESTPLIVVGKQPNKNFTNFIKGAQVYFGIGYTDLSTFNTFCCADNDQDFFDGFVL
jgi:hypothetical protein